MDNYGLTLLTSCPNPARMCSTTSVNMFLSSGQSHLFLMENFLQFPFWTYTSDPIPLASLGNFLKTHHQMLHDVMIPQIKAQPCLSSKSTGQWTNIWLRQRQQALFLLMDQKNESEIKPHLNIMHQNYHILTNRSSETL